MKIRRLALLAGAALSLSGLSLFASPIGMLGGLDIGPITGPHSTGSLFTSDFTVTSLSSTVTGPFVAGPSSFGYFNVVQGSQWLVRNEPVPLLADAIGVNTHIWFSGTPNLSSASAILNDTPYLAAPTPDASWTIFGPTGTSSDWGSNDPQGQTGLAPPAGPPPAGAAVIEGYLRGGVPDIRQLVNECGPTSTTNSLLWLVDKYNLPKDNLPQNPDGSIDQQALLKQLAKAMKPSWDENTPVVNNNRGYPGLSGNDLLNGKTQYIGSKSLPIAVHGGNTDPNAMGTKSFNFIEDQLKAGQDVEFLVFWPNDGAHWVTVVGFTDDAAGNRNLIVHDPDTSKRGNHYWKFKDDGSVITDGGSAGTAGWAVAESPAPEPGTLVPVTAGILALVLARRTRLANRKA